MASAVRRESYDPYRNIAYAYDGSAARVLEQEEVLQPKPKVRPRHKTVARPQVQVRAAGKVSLFAVAGFGLVTVLAAFIISGYVQLSVISAQTVELNNEMSQLKSEEATLRARYELAYDLGAIESAVTSDGSMSRPQAGQMVYVDLTEPDSVVRYNQVEETGGSILDSVEEVIGNLLAYF